MPSVSFPAGKRRPKRGRFALFALLATGCFLLSVGLLAQEPAADKGKDAHPSSAKKSDKPTSPPKVELDEKKPPPGIYQIIDGGFGKAVDVMGYYIFFRVGASQRPYIQFDHEEYYVRDRDKEKEPFQKLDPNGTYPDESLTQDQANALSARGKLVLGVDEGRPFRHGKVENRLVDYVSIVIDKESKFVAVTDKQGNREFRKVVKRGLLSDQSKDILSDEQVRQHALLGHLKQDEGKDAHILSEKHGGAPAVVLWLALGSVFFTIYMRGVNIWAFSHAVQVVRGKYDNPKETGEVTHFQALSSALSATVGLGNIAGVTIAMTMGGPGAFFWMLVCGVFGMTSKFVECTLGQKYREVKPDGTILGGPMQYLHVGLKQLGLGPVGLVLSIVFAVMCIMASFGGGNMFQANQSGAAMLGMAQINQSKKIENLNNEIRKIKKIKEEDFQPENLSQLVQLQTEKNDLQKKMEGFKKIFLPIFGVIFAASVGIVIIGGIRRIAGAAEKIVPTMCVLYVAACLWIIFSHIGDVPSLISSIFTEAFTGKAMGGGLVGVLVLGVQRAAFSNEAGVGSASIAHSAAKTEEPVREGAVALLGPFIDTIIVCSMTALVILITGAWDNDAWVVDQGLAGATLTSKAFEAEIFWFPYVLSIAILLFAYSTIISWSYYGERCWVRLFGPGSSLTYRIIYVGAVFVGAIVNLGAVLDFSDFMILSMAFPNIFGLILLTPQVRRDLLDYWERYKAGKFKTFK